MESFPYEIEEIQRNIDKKKLLGINSDEIEFLQAEMLYIKGFYNGLKEAKRILNDK
jgi:hypothetical protein